MGAKHASKVNSAAKSLENSNSVYGFRLMTSIGTFRQELPRFAPGDFTDESIGSKIGAIFGRKSRGEELVRLA